MDHRDRKLVKERLTWKPGQKVKVIPPKKDRPRK